MLSNLEPGINLSLGYAHCKFFRNSEPKLKPSFFANSGFKLEYFYIPRPCTLLQGFYSEVRFHWRRVQRWELFTKSLHLLTELSTDAVSSHRSIPSKPNSLKWQGGDFPHYTLETHFWMMFICSFQKNYIPAILSPYLGWKSSG